MVPWVRTVTGGGREEQMQEQDEVLLASAKIWDLKCPTAVASLRTEASCFTGIVHSDALLLPYSGPWQEFRLLMLSQIGRRL